MKLMLTRQVTGTASPNDMHKKSLFLISAGGDGSDHYIQDLVQLDYHTHGSCYLDPQLAIISTPLMHGKRDWQSLQIKHTNTKSPWAFSMVSKLVTASFISARQNMTINQGELTIVEEYLLKEANIFNPFSLNIAPHVHNNRIGATVKVPTGKVEIDN